MTLPDAAPPIRRGFSPPIARSGARPHEALPDRASIESRILPGRPFAVVAAIVGVLALLSPLAVPAAGGSGSIAPPSAVYGPALAEPTPLVPTTSWSYPNCTWSGVDPGMTITFGTQRGPAPLAMSWSFAPSGGVGPYNITVHTGDGTTLYGTSMSHTWVVPAMYTASVIITDSGAVCHGASTQFGIYAWGSGGENPATFNVSSGSGPAPLKVTYTVALAGAPSNLTLNWTCFSGNGYGIEMQTGPDANCTFYDQGASDAGVAAYYPNGFLFWTGYGPYVNVTGPSIVSLNVTPSAGTSPVSGSYWVNVTNVSLLPSGYSIAGNLWDGICNGTFSTTNLSISLDTALPFGPLPFEACAQQGGITYWQFDVWVTNATGVLVLYESVDVDVAPAAGSSSYPTISLAILPANGTAPLNVTFQVSATGGAAPYALQIGIVGAGGTLPNGTTLPLYFVNVSGWAGGTANFSRTFSPGSVSIVALVTAADGRQSAALGDVEVSPPPAVPPLVLNVKLSAPSGPSEGGMIAGLEADVSGGALPYTISWRFGDGTVGSSVTGETIDHQYPAAGNYTAVVEVVDAHGTLLERSVSVAISPLASVPSSRTAATAAIPGWAIGVGAATAVLLGVGAVIARREWRRRDGRRLIQSLEERSSEATDRSSIPPR